MTVTIDDTTEKMAKAYYTIQFKYSDVKLSPETAIVASRINAVIKQSGVEQQEWAKKFKYNNEMLSKLLKGKEITSEDILAERASNAMGLHKDWFLTPIEGAETRVVDERQIYDEIAASYATLLKFSNPEASEDKISVVAKLRSCAQRDKRPRKELVNILSVTNETYSNYLAMRSNIQSQVVAECTRFYDVSADWLLAPIGDDVSLRPASSQSQAPKDGVMQIDSITSEPETETVMVNYHGMVKREGSLRIPMDAITAALTKGVAGAGASQARS